MNILAWVFTLAVSYLLSLFFTSRSTADYYFFLFLFLFALFSDRLFFFFFLFTFVFMLCFLLSVVLVVFTFLFDPNYKPLILVEFFFSYSIFLLLISFLHESWIFFLTLWLFLLHILLCFQQDIENELGLTREKLIRMALLLGSDYTEGVR